MLPRALGLPRDPVRAAERIRFGKPRRISLGRINGRRFAFNAGIGLDAELVRRVDDLGRREDGKRPGDLAFALAIGRALAARRFPTRVARGRRPRPGGVRARGQLLALHVRGPLGLRFAPAATFEGGLDVVAPIDVRAARIPRFAMQALRGRPNARFTLLGHDLDRIVIRCDVPLRRRSTGRTSATSTSPSSSPSPTR